MDQHTLRAISEENNFMMDKPYTGDNAFILKPNRLFNNYMDSLTPYLNGNEVISRGLTALKVKEAVLVLLETNPELKNYTFRFHRARKN